ncbi:MAG: cyclic nucleotide-binding domain-containing protein [Bacteriovorax sp.]|nr:cyclic nucleotide-binding domain-containing protein [Bacteriovorax sp.]
MKNLPLDRATDSPILFKAGTVIFSEGEVSNYLFIVKKGQVNLLKKSGQHLHILEICKEKEMLNEVSLLTSKPAEFSAVAKTDIELVLVEQKDIFSILKSGPSWIPEIFQTLCERLSATREIIEEHNLVDGERSSDLILSKEEELKYVTALSEYEAQ